MCFSFNYFLVALKDFFESKYRRYNARTTNLCKRVQRSIEFRASVGFFFRLDVFRLFSLAFFDSVFDAFSRVLRRSGRCSRWRGTRTVCASGITVTLDGLAQNFDEDLRASLVNSRTTLSSSISFVLQITFDIILKGGSIGGKVSILSATSRFTTACDSEVSVPAGFSVFVEASRVWGAKRVKASQVLCIPSTEQVALTFLVGRLLASDAGPGSRVVRATLLGCVPSHSLASWEKSWIAWAAAWFGVRFVTWRLSWMYLKK